MLKMLLYRNVLSFEIVKLMDFNTYTVGIYSPGKALVV